MSRINGRRRRGPVLAAACMALLAGPAARPADAGRRPAPQLPKRTPIPAVIDVQVGPPDDYWDDGCADLEKLLRAESLPQHYAQSVRPDMYRLPADRDVLDVWARRTGALLAAVAALPGAPDLSAERKELDRLVDETEQVRRSGREPGRGELVPFRKLHWRISQANPLLPREGIVFIWRRKSRYGHMCDQFLGKHAVGDGGLFILADPFGPKPRRINVLADAVVANGRLKGRKLIGGSFLGPDLSYDGRQIVFAYCECGKGDDSKRPGWCEQSCFHLFRVNVDGTALVQLTDGVLNDFDPCWLPNGRIGFVSERRGGYGRCHGGRDNPSYTLASILPEPAGPAGDDLALLSYHESNEWQPSVTNDGRIVYTRWDYVDRGTNQAHHPWITTLDGRDARAIHGNYPPTSRDLHARPWMEMDIRAIPGSHKFVATAAPHHGHCYGCLVILDADVEDDDRHSQLRRLTPEASYPEAEGRSSDFATAWPLNEDFFLCAWQGGIWLIDAFGGRQLIYKDEQPCLSPIPLRPRPVPPLVPHATRRGLPAGQQAPADGRRATVALMSVYDGLLPWPDGTRITALRIVQIFSKASVPTPHAGPGRTNIRQALGTVPVEPDGSAHFYAPVNKAIFFQALNERGLAVQSMRSDAYVHPGERLVCQGCHERRYRAPQLPAHVPLALRRQPSEITPEVEGADPYDYDKLVGGLFENKCTPCHEKEGKKIDLGPKALLGLVPYFRSPKPFEPSRTVPGGFGAMGSKLLAKMDQAGHARKLTPVEYRRLTLWLDLNMSQKGPDDIPPAGRLRLAEYWQAPEGAAADQHASRPDGQDGR